MAIRVAPINALVFDQLDFFQANYFTRISGLVVGDFVLKTFFNNGALVWPLITGVGVTDAQVRSGNVYFNEIEPGYYGIRYRPNSIGYWRLDFRYAVGVQAVSLDYDVVTPIDMAASGLRASFVKPGCP